MKTTRRDLLRGQKQIAEKQDAIDLKNKVPTNLKEHRELQKKLKELENAGTEERTVTDSKRGLR